MANKTSHEKCGTQLQKGKVQDIQNKLAHKLQLNLERDILRLFQDSLFCDVKLTVDTSSVLTHSCILRTRACRFYKFIYSEFEVFVQDGVSIFNIYNASFSHLQTFVENIYTNLHSAKAEDCILKHLQEIKTSKVKTTETRSLRSAITPDSDLFFTPKSSPSEIQKPFGPSKLKYKENNVASYYKIVSVDDIPVDEKLEKNSEKEEIDEELEKELAEQDELLSSFEIIFSKKAKSKPNSLSLGNSSQSTKKIKPKFNRKFDCNVVLYDGCNKGKPKAPLWKPNPVTDQLKTLRKNKKGYKILDKLESETNLEDTINSLCNSDMEVSTTGGDSGLDNSSICQQEVSPRENTVSETSGVDLTEAAINEEIPNDETLSTKQSTGSSVSSEVGTWDANDDYKRNNYVNEDPTTNVHLNEDEILRLDQMEKNIRDCEIFLFMEKQASAYDRLAIVKNIEEPEKTPTKELAYQYAKEEKQNEVNNPEAKLQGEVGHYLNNDEEENYYNYNGRNSDDAITSSGNLNNVNLSKENEDLSGNECSKEGVSNDLAFSSNYEYAKNSEVQETKTPPCTPKKSKVENLEENNLKESEPDVKPKNWECNGSTGVSNYFIDASSLLDEDEIISPPISLINFKSLQSCNETNTKPQDESLLEEKKEDSPRESISSPDSANEDKTSFMKEQEKRQGEIIFRNSIPSFSKHEVEDDQIFDRMERLRGGADHYVAENIEDDNEQVVPSADIYVHSSINDEVRHDVPESTCDGNTVFFEKSVPSESPGEVEDRNDYDKDMDNESQAIPSSRESVREVSSSSVCSGSPNLRRRNEAAPILSGGMDYIEDEKKVSRKPSQSQGEAWIVTFENNKKPRNRFTSSETGSEVDSGRENSDERRAQSRSYSREGKRNEPSVEFYIREPNTNRNEDSKPERRMNPVEKSSSFGYFLDFGKDSEPSEPEQEKSDLPSEKKNMFSMFIGMDENSRSTFSRKPKPALEKEKDKSLEDRSETPDCSEDVKKSFYMFIESDSPKAKRKPMPKKLSQNPTAKTYLRTQSYTIERQPEEQGKSENKGEFECSSSDNSLPYIEGDKVKLRGKLPLGKFRGPPEPRLTAWSKTKVPNENEASSESWLKTKDIQVNYTGKSDDLYLKKDSTFVMDNEYKGKYEKGSFKGLKVSDEVKPHKRDSGVILSERNEDNFVKLSDLDNSDTNRLKQAKEKMSQSITERSSRSFNIDETPLSKSAGNEGGRRRDGGSYEKQVNQSLIRLFPNLSQQDIAKLARKEGDFERSEIENSEVSSSLQSSMEPFGLEISTSDTDLSSHVGGTSRLGEDLLRMFLEEISPDIVIEVIGRKIKAHKCILTSRCQYFAAKLSGGWVESAGNVLPLQGFSYNAVHFALRHIYSGESRIPESLDITELADLADMLCLDGLQEIISHYLKVKYCHSFHVPCSVCSVKVIDCLRIAISHGLDDLSRKCMRWITKYFVKLWPTKSFGTLPNFLLDKCYDHYVVHMTVDNVLDTLVNIDKVRGSLPNVRWAENVSRLVRKLHDATIRYIADHFSSVLTSDSFLALGKEAGWNVGLLEDSLMETIKYLPPEQACWSHARLHRILSVATEPDPPPEMDWNEDFLKLLQLIAELVENSLIKQAPRAAKSKAWRQMEPELRSRIQEAACLVLPDPEPSPTYRRPNFVRREVHQTNVPQTAKSRNLEIRQIKLAMSQQANRNPNTNRPLSLQIDQRPKKDTRFLPLRPSVSTSSVRKPEPVEGGIRKTQSRSQILGSTISEPKKTVNPRYSEVKSRYLEPRSPQKTVTEKAPADSTQRRSAVKYISSSDSSRNCSPALRPSNYRSSIPQAKKTTLAINRHSAHPVLRSDSASTVDSRRDRSFASAKSDPPSSKTLSRLTGEENMSTDSLCTDSLLSEKEATLRRRPGKENVGDRKSSSVVKSTSGSPVTKRNIIERVSVGTKTAVGKKSVLAKPTTDNKSAPLKRFTTGKIPVSNQSSPRSTTNRNQRNSVKQDPNLVNGNANRRRNEVDSENNKKNSKDCHPTALSRSGTFLKDEPTILKKPQIESEV